MVVVVVVVVAAVVVVVAAAALVVVVVLIAGRGGKHAFGCFGARLQHLRASFWGGTRVLGVTAKGSVGAACVCWACLKIGRESVCVLDLDDLAV